MLLASIGENIAPSLIEVVGGVGVGAYVLPDNHISFLSGYSGLPDKAISRALTVLGFEFTEEAQKNPDHPPFEKIRQILKTSPVIFGPLDMGFLVYDPDVEHHHRIDHFVFVYAMDENKAFLHDPAGFPNVSISLEKLASAWKAERIQYKEGYYRYWASPKRISNPTEEEIYNNTLENIKDIYITGEKYAKAQGKTIDSEAIMFMADNIKKGLLKPFEIEMLTGFIFPLGARRASDFSDFFKPYNQELSKIKAKQSNLLGLCHTASVAKDWPIVTTYLREYAKLEKKFKNLLR
jgi:hypothetical protein